MFFFFLFISTTGGVEGESVESSMWSKLPVITFQKFDVITGSVCFLHLSALYWWWWIC